MSDHHALTPKLGGRHLEYRAERMRRVFLAILRAVLWIGSSSRTSLPSNIPSYLLSNTLTVVVPLEDRYMSLGSPLCWRDLSRKILISNKRR